MKKTKVRRWDLRRMIVFSGVAISFVFLSNTGCADRRAQPSTASRGMPVMGTEAVVVLPAYSGRSVEAAAEIVWAVCNDIEKRVSVFCGESELSAVNRQAGAAPVAVSAVTLEIVAMALEYARLSEGAFDPTVAPLLRLWRGNGDIAPQSLPDSREIRQQLKLVGHSKARVDRDEGTVFLEKEGMMLDLGGIAKGFATDRATAALQAAGYEAFLVNLGGDIRCVGAPDGTAAWRVGVRDPFNAGNILGVLSMGSLPAVATSGNYERFVEIDGKEYGHLIDPRTGGPARGMAGVTVLAADAATADALSTALFVAGIDRAPAILARMTDVEALLIPDAFPLQIWVTPGFADSFAPLPEHENALRRLPVKRGNAQM